CRSFAMDVLSTSLLVTLCFLCPAITGVFGRHVGQRNLFTERGCCRRQSHFIYVGQDVSGSPISVDVGLCRSHCGGYQGASGSYGSGIPGYSKHTSLLEFLRSKKSQRERQPSPEAPEPAGLVASCSAGAACVSAGVRVERVLLFDGVREVEVTEECHCEPSPPECVRMPALKTYFFETPYETVVDVGKCSKPPGTPDGISCVPTKFSSALVETPSKMELIQTAAACDLRENCYRVSYKEYYYEVFYNSNGVKEEKLKEIDVGRCLGSCTSGNRCLLRDSSPQEQCRVWAERPARSCVPRDFDSHAFRSRHGQVRTVLSITSCACRP
uniref:Pinhead n=1 Tax=Lepisosteus oculatus TaxID=7918 RepID=W5M6C0_LEPOC